MTRAVIMALLAAACGSQTPSGDPGSAQVPVVSVAPATTVPVPAGPVKVLLAGDSIMGSLAPALKAALGNGEGADVRFKLTPVLGGDPPLRLSWEQELPLFDPDVVVMFLGVWETATLRLRGYNLAEPDDAARYQADVLDPWVRFVTARGARVVWVGHAPVGVPELQRRFDAFEPHLRELPERWPGLRFVSSTVALNGRDDGVFHNTVAAEDGTVVRTRQVDGLHLCPDGAARLAAVLIRAVGAELPVDPAWPSGVWRQDATAFPPGKCPAVH